MLDDLMHAVNLRDIGGVRTAGGATVRRGRIYRSAALTDLAGARLEAVRALGIRTIVDLRRNGERGSFPTPWAAIGASDYWGRDYDLSDADHLARVRRPGATAEESRRSITATYRELPYGQAEAYARLFRAIAADAGPVLFHCAVGKDRTGVAAALILMAADVPRDAIQADYAATARFDMPGSPHLRGAGALPAEHAAALAPLYVADAAYLETMFAALAERSGTIEAYLRDTLALSREEREALGRALIEPA